MRCQARRANDQLDLAAEEHTMIALRPLLNLRWLLTILLVTSLSTIVVLWFLETGFFRRSYGEFRFMYYCIVISVISLTIYVVSVYYPSHRFGCVAASTISGYVASVLSYLVVTSPQLAKRLAWGHWEVFLVVWIFPFHLLFVTAALISGIIVVIIARRIDKDDYRIV